MMSSNDVSNFAFKDCKTSCVGDGSVEGGAVGCNDDNEVEALFSNGKVSTCKACHFSESSDNIGDPDCEDGLGSSKSCARFEDQS